jgi:hypothetical protein
MFSETVLVVCRNYTPSVLLCAVITCKEARGSKLNSSVRYSRTTGSRVSCDVVTMALARVSQNKTQEMSGLLILDDVV